MLTVTIERWSYPGSYPDIFEPDGPWIFEVELDFEFACSQGRELVGLEIREAAGSGDEDTLNDIWHQQWLGADPEHPEPPPEKRNQAVRCALRALIEGNVSGLSSLLPDAAERRLELHNDLIDFLRDTPLEQLLPCQLEVMG